MNQLDVAILTIGAVVLILGTLVRVLRRSWLSPPMISLAVGVLLGPAVTGWLDGPGWTNWREILMQASRLTLAISLMEVGLRIPPRYFLDRWRSIVTALTLVMVLMWLVSGLLAWALLGTGFWLAMLVGAAVTPTDPVLASSIVSGEEAAHDIPARLRHTLSFESGANDGLAYLLALLPILMLEHEPVRALREWLLVTLLREVLLAVVVGYVAGLAAGRLLQWARKRNVIESSGFLAFATALALAVLGATSLLKSDAVLAAFMAGRGLANALPGSERIREQHVEEAINQFFILPAFVLIGVLLPWEAWARQGPMLLLFAGLVLLLRRLPAVFALARLMPVLRRPRDALFYGWFGPIGVSAVYYCMLAHERGGHELVWTVGSMVIVFSVVAHGVSAAPAARSFARSRGLQPHAGQPGPNV